MKGLSKYDERSLFKLVACGTRGTTNSEFYWLRELGEWDRVGVMYCRRTLKEGVRKVEDGAET